jgi:predicted Zn-dependent peptidase
MKFIYTLLAALLVSTAIAQPSKKTTPKATPLDRSIVPQPGPAPKIQIGKATVNKLDNGMKVIVVENHKLPNVTYSLSLNLTPIAEGKKAGYISIAGDLLSAGTETKTKAQIDESIDFIGGSLSTSASSVSGSCLSKHSETLLGLMQDVLLHPSFPIDELEKTRKQMISGLTSEKTDPNAVSDKIGNVVRYGVRHPYGEFMTESTLSNITREDLMGYYQTYFSPSVATLVIVGDVTPEQAFAQANKYFGAWTGNAVPVRTYPAPAELKANQVAFVAMPGAVQSVIDVTYAVSLNITSSDYLAATVLNNILGGSGFQTRLMQNLREDKAYTYGAYSSMSPDDVIGNFSAGASVRNDVSDSAIVQLLFEMDRLCNEAVSAETLKSAKSIMSGAFARRLESAGTVAQFAYNISKYNLPADYYETYLERLNAITAEDVQAAAKKYLKPNNCYISVVGNKDILEKLKPFSKNGEVMQFNTDGSVSKGIIPPAAGVTAATVVEAYYAANGGKDKFKKVKSMKQEGKMSVQGTSINIETLTFDNKMLRVEVSMGPMKLSTQIFDGTNLVMKSMGKEAPVAPADILKAKMEADFFLRDHMADFGYSLNLAGSIMRNEKEVYMLETLNEKKKVVKTEYFDKASGQLVSTYSVEEGPEGAVTSETNFKDFMTVDGMIFPKTIQINAGGQALDMTIEKITINGKVSKKAFKVD